MISGKILVAAIGIGLAIPAAQAAPLSTGVTAPERPLVLIRDGGLESKAYRNNYTMDDWRFGDERYGRYSYGPYYGPRGRHFGYQGYYGGPSIGLGLSPYRYGGPSAGIYINP